MLCNAANIISRRDCLADIAAAAVPADAAGLAMPLAAAAAAILATLLVRYL